MNKKSIIAVLGVVVVILIGTTVYFTTINKESQPVAPAQKVVQQPVSAPVPAVQQPTKPVAPTSQPTDETANWQTYSSDMVGVSFKYPNNWFVEEDLSIGRIYIKNVKNAVNKGDAPSDFQQVWISTWTQENSSQTETNVRNGNPDGREIIGSVSASTMSSNGIMINMYEYETAGGPTLQAFWTNKTGKKYYATNSTEVETINQQNMVANLKKILSTFKFTK